MSSSYGVVYGYGIPVDGLGDRVVPEKFIKFCREKGIWFDEDDRIIEEDGFDSTIIVDCLSGSYTSVEEVFADLDDTGLLDYDNGEMWGGYLLYYPTYPWNKGVRVAESKEQVENAIIKAVQKLTDLTDDEIKDKIKYIEDYYC